MLNLGTSLTRKKKKKKERKEERKKGRKEERKREKKTQTLRYKPNKIDTGSLCGKLQN